MLCSCPNTPARSLLPLEWVATAQIGLATDSFRRASSDELCPRRRHLRLTVQRGQQYRARSTSSRRQTWSDWPDFGAGSWPLREI